MGTDYLHDTKKLNLITKKRNRYWETMPNIYTLRLTEGERLSIQ